jgi:hypothetical protein
MCFSENQSYINTLLLFGGGIYLFPIYRLSIPLFFLGIKDILQGLSYRFQNNKYVLNILARLSWIHICFHPLMTNIAASYFSKGDEKYWNYIFAICIIFGIILIFTLKDFDVINMQNCVKKTKFDDFCSTLTSSYIGKYHLGYQFRRVNDYDVLFPILYFLLMFIPALFTKSRVFILIWLVFVISIYYNFVNIGRGEQAAIWCYISILFLLPTALLHKHMKKIMI